jgi:DNA-binding NarL/FixJ family response regulator
MVQLDDDFVAETIPDVAPEARLVAAVIAQSIADARRWPRGHHATWLRDGTELRELASLIGLDAEHVHRTALEVVDPLCTQGTPVKRHKHHVHTKASPSRYKEAVERLCTQGLSVKAIAVALGINPHTVRRYYHYE